ncbi:MAG: hypothetical protein PHW75_02215 [Patescibacteria group bacterium]|nr:hypothetical protein [Patescibacteria group bacterium]
MSSKNVLMALGAVVAVMGLLAVFNLLDLGTEPVWHSWVKVVVGAAAVYVGYADKGGK